METSLLKIILPLLPIFRPEQHLSGYVNETIDELLELSNNVEIELKKLGAFPLSIKLLNDFELTQKKRFLQEKKALVFEITIPHSNKIIDSLWGSGEETSENEKDKYLEEISYEFQDQVFQFIVLSQIAKPGTIKSRRGDVCLNERVLRSFYSTISIHRESLDDVKSLKWPNYMNLKIIDVWNWFNENDFSSQRFSKSKTEIALNAFSKLFGSDLSNISIDLIWSLIGIEALYCSGKEGLSEQIFKKTQVFLGEILDFKKRLKQMYDFRSRLIHGDLNIPPNHYYDDGDEENVKFEEDLYGSTILAVAVLTATLQKMVHEKRNCLNFKYVIEK